MRYRVWFLFCLSGLAAGASGPTPSTPAQWERGLASWYGAPYSGRKAASGEIYHQEVMTAAHRTLPFGSLVRVHRLDQHRSILVRINDRGPFIEPRIIDLSYAAAVRLGMAQRGLVPVALEIVESPVPDPNRAFCVELHTFRTAAPVQVRPAAQSKRIRVTVRSPRTVSDAAGTAE